MVDDITQLFDNSMFRGVVHGAHYPEICEFLGGPNEYLDVDGDEKEHCSIYYFNNGKIICHWDGATKWPIGAIDFVALENKPMYFQKKCQSPINLYSITEKQKS